MTDSGAVAPASERRVSDWLGSVFAAVMVGMFLAGLLLDIQSFAWFLWTLGVDVLMLLAFAVWWFTRRPFSRWQRFGIFACAFVFGVAAGVLTRHTIAMPPFLIFAGVPILVSVWWIWFILTRGVERRTRMAGLVACVGLAWCPFLLIRMTGYRGNLQADVHWRWTPTAEQMYLAERANDRGAIATTQPARKALSLQPGDWPAFRGPNRDGIVRGLQIGLDWTKAPPKVLWRERVGPAWSSMIIVDGFVITQEQRADREAVVSRDAMTGHEVWVHEDPVRFEEAMSGIGPRATPAFDKGRIYVQGTLGALHCLDAATGRVIWTRDVRKDSDAPLPMWGFSNSPLVMDERVIVFAGGEQKKGLLAYSAKDGQVLWTADAGKMSYASPQAFNGPGGQMILMFSNEGLFALDPPTGQIRWQLPIVARVGLPAALQVCMVASNSLVMGNGAAFGAERVEVGLDAAVPTRKWVTERMKPAFSDMVYHDGFIYGFDGTVFCCVDATTGARRWREGRYGAGQVVLLADQGVMIVSSEDGQVILLRCNPAKSEELGRVQAISGKAWNHPAVAGDRLYVRSDAEMACLQLTAIEGK